jgi:hypothetical protein
MKRASPSELDRSTASIEGETVDEGEVIHRGHRAPRPPSAGDGTPRVQRTDAADRTLACLVPGLPKLLRVEIACDHLY